MRATYNGTTTRQVLDTVKSRRDKNGGMRSRIEMRLLFVSAICGVLSLMKDPMTRLRIIISRASDWASLRRQGTSNIDLRHEAISMPLNLLQAQVIGDKSQSKIGK